MSLSEQDATLLEQAAELLEGVECDQRDRGNDSTAAGAGCSAHAVRRLAVSLSAMRPMTKVEVRDQMTDLAHSAHSEALSFGLSVDTFTRYMQAVVAAAEAHHGIKAA